jgi:hypothetical protein
MKLWWFTTIILLILSALDGNDYYGPPYNHPACNDRNMQYIAARGSGLAQFVELDLK